MADPLVGRLVFPREYWMAYARHKNNGQRQGQATFNAIHELWPDVANALRGSSYDPFYNDAKTDQFLDVVIERLTNPGSKGE